MKKTIKGLTETQIRERLLRIMMQHIGEENAIDMGALHEQVFEERIDHKINHSRPIRKAIEDLQYDGTRIISSKNNKTGGYFIARTGSELADYCERDTHRALKILKKVSILRKVPLPAMLGQMQMNLRPGADRTAQK